MWLSAFCATLVISGFGCERDQQPLAPDSPISVYGYVQGRGQAGMLIVQVTAQAEAPHALVELALPDGVRVVGVQPTADADVEVNIPQYFRFPLKADRPGTYIIGIKVMAGEDSYRFGKSNSVAWIAQAD